MLAELGHPERHVPTIHIGGTNGKGSTCAFLAAELASRGLKVAVYTSPHLVSPRERITVGGRAISEEGFAAWTLRLRSAIERTEASFFEAVTAVAFADFAARGADVAIVEVGLGGRLDATNVITPLVSAVTKIAREHTDYLGTALDGIAREKAGIAKPGVPFVVGETDPALRQVLVQTAHACGADPVRIAEHRGVGPGVLGLVGPHQWANAWVAVAVLNALPRWLGPAPGEAVPPSFARAFVPGRFDVRGRWIFDVAHNPDGMAVLVRALQDLGPPQPIHALVGIRGDKDWRAMLELLLPHVDRCIVTVPPSVPAGQSWSLAEVAAWATAGARGGAVEADGDFARALAATAAGGRTAVVTGSFHTVGDALARLPGFAPLG